MPIAPLIDRGVGPGGGVKYLPGLGLNPPGGGSPPPPSGGPGSALIGRGIGPAGGLNFLPVLGLSVPGTPPPPASGFVQTSLVWAQPNPVPTYELLVDVGGSGGEEFFAFDFTKALAALGPGFALSGTPTVLYVGNAVANDGNLTLGAPVLDTTKTKVGLTVGATAAAAGVGGYRLSCACQATDGVTRLFLVGLGRLVVFRVQ